MILYLPEPFDFGAEEKKYEQSFSIKLPSGGELVVERCGQNQVKVIGIRSTEPMDYINVKFQPGSVIDLSPNID